MNEKLFAHRMGTVHKSFIREILKVTEDPKIISFAGGLPDPQFFPVKEIAKASLSVLEENGNDVLQYSTTEGYLPLREYIAGRYREKKGLPVDPDEIVITNGSQQGIDLIGKLFLDTGDQMVIERPGYLGAIQAFSMYEPVFQPVPLLDDGIDPALLERACTRKRIKLFYAVPNFQNPSGITYSRQRRRDVANILKKHDAICVEDDPYGELRFIGDDLPSIRAYHDDNTILLGSFSKILAPGLRLGWVCAKKDIMERIIVAKQASDLHSNYLSQRIIYRYLIDNDIDHHIQKIRDAYKKRRDLMVSMIAEYVPEVIHYTKPEGGMFLWITLPKGVSSLDLVDRALKNNVAFVPGKAFYVDGGGNNTVRLNFSNPDEEKIEEGMKRLAKSIKTTELNSI